MFFENNELHFKSDNETLMSIKRENRVSNNYLQEEFHLSEPRIDNIGICNFNNHLDCYNGIVFYNDDHVPIPGPGIHANSEFSLNSEKEEEEQHSEIPEKEESQEKFEKENIRYKYIRGQQ